MARRGGHSVVSVTENAHQHKPLMVQAPVRALDADGMAVVSTGTVAFAVAAVVCWFTRTDLAAIGKLWYLGVSLTGTALGLLMVQSEQERPQATAALMEYRLRYEAASAVVRARLFLYRWGIGTVDAAPLVRVFDAIRVELRQVMPSAVPACA